MFHQIEWTEPLIDDCRQLIRLAVREDLDRSFDLTTLSLVEADSRAQATLVARAPGRVCGLAVAELTLVEMNIPYEWEPLARDGDTVAPAAPLAILRGPARHLLTSERIILNFLGRLCGVATLTAQFTAAVAGSRASVYDTRKTTPGWRRLEKYAVRCGGGMNHRTGLFDAVLIKDNHLAQWATTDGCDARKPAAAIQRTRAFLAENPPQDQVPIEIEVDTLEQLRAVLPEAPDIVLLDNMSLEQLREAVQLRDASGVATELEASGGITLDTIADIAAVGVDRISVGALTHSAPALDVGMDWCSQ